MAIPGLPHLLQSGLSPFKEHVVNSVAQPLATTVSNPNVSPWVNLAVQVGYKLLPKAPELMHIDVATLGLFFHHAGQLANTTPYIGPSLGAPLHHLAQHPDDAVRNVLKILSEFLSKKPGSVTKSDFIEYLKHLSKSAPANMKGAYEKMLNHLQKPDALNEATLHQALQGDPLNLKA